MKEHPLFEIIKEYLEQPQNEITIHPVDRKGDIPITITLNLPPDVSQNEMIFRYPNSTVSCSYRNGKRTGLKCAIKKFVSFKENSGNNTDVPVTRQLVASLAKDDTHC